MITKLALLSAKNHPDEYRQSLAGDDMLEVRKSLETVKPLSAAELCWRYDPDQFDFGTTNELEELSEIIGQPWAVDAMQFGINIGQEGYNTLACASSCRMGKRTLLHCLFEDCKLGEKNLGRVGVIIGSCSPILAHQSRCHSGPHPDRFVA